MSDDTTKFQRYSPAVDYGEPTMAPDDAGEYVCLADAHRAVNRIAARALALAYAVEVAFERADEGGEAVDYQWTRVAIRHEIERFKREANG